MGPRIDSVLLRYHLIARTGQLSRLSPSLWCKLGKEMGAAVKLLRSFLARKLGRKCSVAPRLENIMCSLIAKACSSEHRRPDASASRNAVLIAVSRREADSIGSNGRRLRASRTLSRSQAGQILRLGGAELCMPSISSLSESSFLRDLPSGSPS